MMVGMLLQHRKKRGLNKKGKKKTGKENSKKRWDEPNPQGNNPVAKRKN